MTQAITLRTVILEICRNEKSPFRALTQFVKFFTGWHENMGRNEKSPFRALTLFKNRNAIIEKAVEIRKARLAHRNLS